MADNGFYDFGIYEAVDVQHSLPASPMFIIMHK
jgi:hypothetical protein